MLCAHVGHNHGKDFLVLAQESGLDTRPAPADFINRRGDVFSGADIPEWQRGAEAVAVDRWRCAHIAKWQGGAEADLIGRSGSSADPEDE